MRPFIYVAAVVIFATQEANAPRTACAQTAPGALPPGARQADRHNPFSSRYAGPGSSTRRFSSGNLHGSHGHSHGHHHHVNNFVLFPPYYFSYGTGAYYRGGYPYSRFYSSPGAYGNYGYPYPVYVPQYIPVPYPQYVPQPRPQPQPQQAAAPAPPKPRASNESARDRARSMLNHGDARLASGDYHRALQRYKSAARAASDQSDAYFRQAQAYVALGLFDKAADALRKGITRQPNWAETNYSVAEAYGQDLEALDTHRERIEGAVGDDPRNDDLWFLLGVYAYFEGERETAADAFEQAFHLGPEDRSHLRQFRAELNPEPPAGDDDKGAANKRGVEI